MKNDPITKCFFLCHDFLVLLAPEVIKNSPMRLDLVVFSPWVQKSTKRKETFRIALGNEKERFCLIKPWFSYIYARSHQELPWAPRELPGANRTFPEHQWAAITGALVLAK